MPRPPTTDPTVNKHGQEEHPSWVSVRVNKASVSPPGAQLVDSDIRHQHIVVLHISRVTRRRDLHRTWWHETQRLAEIEMSEAQFAAMITSFGDGGAKPATLTYWGGDVEQQTAEHGEIAKAIAETRASATEQTAEAREAYARVQEAFDQNLGRRDMRERLDTLARKLDHLPGNMAFAAKSMQETIENVVTKARHDIEATVEARARAFGIEIDARPVLRQLMTGEEPTGD